LLNYSVIPFDIQKMDNSDSKYASKNSIKKVQQAALRRFLRGQGTPIRIREWIGLNSGELKQLLESRMIEGMTWENYGEFWHVDHIAPFWIFNLEDESDLKLLWHPDNLLPLIGKDNNHKQGDLRFALMLFEKMPAWSYAIENIIVRLEKEIKVQEKYEQSYLRGTYYNPVG
jgi:hypothetical protein